MKTPKYYNALLVIACIAVFAVNLDVLPVNIMEARNFITAREMLQDNNWIFTTINGVERYQKPPLPTWLTAISASIFGLKNLFGMRLPAVLVTILMTLFFFKLVTKLTSNKSLAFVSSLILITSFYVIFSGRNGQWDIFTHSFMLVAIYYLHALFSGSKKGGWPVIIASLFLGASILSKGPVSLYALLLSFLIAYGGTYGAKSILSKWKPLVAFFVIGILVGGSWYGYVSMYDSESFTRITEKETTNWTSYNVRPFYYYWSFFTQSGIWTIPAFVSLLYPYLKDKVSHKKGYTLSVLWTIISVILLSLFPEKKSRYLLPVLIPMALSTGFYIEYLLLNFKKIKSKWEKGIVYFNFGLIGLLGVIIPVAMLIYFNESLITYVFPFTLLFLSLVSIGIMILWALKRNNINHVFYGVIAFVVSCMCFALPLIGLIQDNPKYNSLATLQEKTLPFSVYENGGFSPEIVWDYGDKIPLMNRMETVPSTSFYLLVDPRDISQVEDLFNKRNYKKLEVFDINPGPSSGKNHKERLVRYLFFIP